jgi:putative hydrolase of the HAD superfamily
VSGFKAVLWDFGGVITSSPFDAFRRYEMERGLPRDFIRGVNAVNPDSNAWALLERSEIDAATFDHRFAEEAAALGYDVRGADVLALLAGDVRPRMVAALDRLRADGFALGCITNNAKVGEGPGMTVDAEKSAVVARIMARFDHVIESSRAGVRKPDPRIYAMMCEALGIEPERCVYLDDLGINCKPAAAMGMTAIKVTAEDQALAELGQVLGIRFA